MEPATAKTKRLYVGNLAFRTSWQGLKDHFKKAGEVTYAKVITENRTTQSGRPISKGWGIVEYATISDAQKAIDELHDSELDGRKIFIREDREDRDLRGTEGYKGKGAGAGAAAENVGRRLYVGNLAFRTSWQGLKDHFKTVGDVVYAKVESDGTSINGRPKSKGWGIVEYSNNEDAKKAITELNDSELDGRNVWIREDREDYELRGGGGGGKGRGKGKGKSN